MNTELLAVQLTDPAIMLETLKLAYRHGLDNASEEGGERIGETRLTGKEQKELGRRLAAYWLVSKEEVTPRAITKLERSKGRSESYHQMSGRDQWDEDKRLGILDWDGS